MVCRCPECGSFHPAGRGIAAGSKWLARLGGVTLAAWVVFCLFVVLLGSFILCGMQYAYLSDFSSWEWRTADGQRVVWDYNNGKAQYVVASTRQPVANNQVIKRRVPDEGSQQSYSVLSPGDYEDRTPFWQRLIPYVIVSTIVGVILGVLFAVACWHWKRRAYFALLLPFLLGAIAFSLWRTPRESAEMLRWALSRTAIHAGFQALVLALAIGFGRPMARLTLRLALPPSLRQHFAFLWAADGKRWSAIVPSPSPAFQSFHQTGSEDDHTF